MGIKQTRDGIVSALYEAALEPSALDKALGKIAEAVGADHVHYMHWNGTANQPDFTHVWSKAPELSEAADLAYCEHYGHIDPRRDWTPSHPGIGLPCQRVFDDHYVSLNEFYQDFPIPNAARHTTGLTLPIEGAITLLLGILRGPGHTSYSDREVHLLHSLNPALTHSARLLRRILSLQAQAAIGLGVLDTMGFPVCVVNEHGFVVFANREAETSFTGTIKLRSGHLDTGTAVGTLALRQHIHAAVTHGTGGVMRLERGKGLPGLHIQVVPLAPHTAWAATWQRPMAMVMVSDSARCKVPPEVQLRQLYGLTTAEARLAAGLARGLSPEECALEVGIGLATVRSQTRALLAKTGCQRQSRMISLLTSFVPISEITPG